MASIGDALMNAIYGDQQQKLQDYANQQQLRDRASQGLDANGNILPAGAAPPPADVLPASQTPNAMKTPESMGSILVGLQRQSDASAGLNQALGLGFAAFAQPRDREMVSKAFNSAEPDAQKLGDMIMRASGFQSGQDRLDALGQMIQGPQGAAIARSLNMPGADDATRVANLLAAYRADPQGVGRMIQTTQQPTPQMANIEQITRYMDQVQQRDPSKSPEVLTMIKNAMLAGMGGPDAEAAIGDAVAYKNRTGKDAPWVANGAINKQLYTQYQANEAQKETDRGSSAKVLADNQNTAEEIRSDLERLRDSPGLKSILGDQAKKELALSAMRDANVSDVPSIMARYALNGDEAAAVATLRKIGGQATESAMRSMAGTGTRVTQQEVGPLKDAISATQNLNQDYGNYVHNAINPFITKIKKTVANAYGASGNLAHMDPEYEPWLHPIYRAGHGGQPAGELYKEGSGAENLPDLQPVPVADLAAAKKEAMDYPIGKQDVLDSLQQRGFDVSKLRRTDPSKWGAP